MLIFVFKLYIIYKNSVRTAQRKQYDIWKKYVMLGQ